MNRPASSTAGRHRAFPDPRGGTHHPIDIEDHDAITKALDAAISSTLADMSRWLNTEESHRVGWTHEGGHQGVRREAGPRLASSIGMVSRALKS